MKVSAPGSGRAWGGGEKEENVLLEEIRLKKVPEPDFFKPDGPLGHLLKLLPGGEPFDYTRKLFARQLLIVSDHDFKEFVETGTEVLTRIKLNFLGTTRTLKREDLTKEENERARDIDLQGNLFVEEVVPPESLFLAALRGGETAGDLVKALQSRTVIRFATDWRAEAEQGGFGAVVRRRSAPRAETGRGSDEHDRAVFRHWWRGGCRQRNPCSPQSQPAVRGGNQRRCG